MAEFIYEKPFPLKEDPTVYKLISKEHVSTINVDGREVLKVDAKALEIIAAEAMADVSFMLRTAHLEKVAKILDDPEATDNDRFVAHTLLKNAEIAIYALGVMYFPLVMFIGAARWKVLIKQHLQKTEKFSFLVRHYWVGMSIGFFMPGSRVNFRHSRRKPPNSQPLPGSAALPPSGLKKIFP